MSYSYELINNTVNYKLTPFTCSKCQQSCHFVPYIIVSHSKKQVDPDKLFCSGCARIETEHLNTLIKKISEKKIKSLDGSFKNK